MPVEIIFVHFQEVSLEDFLNLPGVTAPRPKMEVLEALHSVD
jgi:hypothetical protein